MMSAPLLSTGMDARDTAGLFALPAWVVSALGSSPCQEVMTIDDLSVHTRENGDFCLVTVRLRLARQLSLEQFEFRTAQIYRVIVRKLRAMQASHPVRIWNYLPDIHASDGTSTDRYMAFNAGRFQAFSECLGGSGTFDCTVPTASAVGHDGADLVIHALGFRRPGIAIANPRQIAPHRYSKRFGPVPPCFARATVLPMQGESRNRILVGGTASICGEESVHLGDIERQIQETFDNLAYLVQAATGGQFVNCVRPDQSAIFLNYFRELRVYYVRESDRALIEEKVAEAFSACCPVEFIRADLCRAELLVEIEGLAEYEAALKSEI